MPKELSMDGEVASYWSEPDVFDDEDIDPMSDEWEVSEYESCAGDR